MTTRNLRVNRDIILATKRRYLKERQQKTPTDAVLSLAQMQRRPRSLLNQVNDGDQIRIIAQVTRTETYDPVTSALHCLVNGADAIAFFTDHAMHKGDLDDLLMVARAVKMVPVLYQNYILDEYGVIAARSADASAVMLYSSILSPERLRQVVSMAQRWKMSVLVQANTPEELEFARELSPHAISYGEMLSNNVERTVAELSEQTLDIPHYARFLLSHTLSSVPQVEKVLRLPVDALIVSEALMRQEHTARRIQALVQETLERRSYIPEHSQW